MKEHIDYLIELRRRIGIEYDDSVDTEGTTSTCYVGEIEGNNGTILIKIGEITAPTETGYDGNNPIYAGKNFAIWEKDVNDSAAIVRVLTFTRPAEWGEKVNAYFFDTETVGAAWPGTEMEWIGQNDLGQEQYTIAVPTEAENVIFNDGSKQTVDIPLSPTEVGYYTTGTNGEDKYTVCGFNQTPTEPTPEPDNPDSSDPESGISSITFYVKIPVWSPVISTVKIALNGNGYSWNEFTMSSCSTAQWYKYEAKSITDIDSKITYQLRLTQSGQIKYQCESSSSNGDPSITAPNGFVVIDLTKSMAWNGDKFYTTEIPTPDTDPAY
jgi:hypothetical protein